MSSELRVDKIVPVDGVPANGGGGIVQLTYGNTSTEVPITTTGSWQQVYTSISSITPKFSTSKILIDMRCCWYQNSQTSGADYFDLRFTRTVGGTTTSITEYMPGYNGWFDSASNLAPMSNNHFQYLDSPGTTNTVSYGFEIYINGMTSTAISFSYDDGGGNQITTMTLMEVSA